MLARLWMLVYFFTNFIVFCSVFFFFSSRRRHTRLVSDWSSDVCSSDLNDCQCQRECSPQRGQPAVGVLVPCKQGQQSGSRERMKEGDGAGVAVFRRGFT